MTEDTHSPTLSLQEFLASLPSDALREAYSRMTDAKRESVHLHLWIRSST